MNFVVVDFEWNQALRSDSPVFNRLPIHLRGEIIEIGAVRLNADLTLGEEFTIDIRPVYFRQIHYRVKQITGFDKERLSHGVSFPEAVKKFREFCGDDVTFLTWGSDDRGIFEQNIIIHDLEWDWIADWINMQLIYNVQTGGDKNQTSLSDAMEHFSIEQTRRAHDALGDAYNTALVCSRLDMREGIRTYDDAPRILASRMLKNTVPAESPSEGPEPLLRDVFTGYESKASAFADHAVSVIPCPVCAQEMQGIKWVNQGDGRYMNLYTCKDHGKYLVRVRFKKMEDDSIFANRLVYECDEDMASFYKEKSTQARRRGRSRRSRSSTAKKTLIR